MRMTYLHFYSIITGYWNNYFATSIRCWVCCARSNVWRLPSSGSKRFLESSCSSTTKGQLSCAIVCYSCCAYWLTLEFLLVEALRKIVFAILKIVFCLLFQTTHKKTFFYLEQLIIKHQAHKNTLRIKQQSEGLDFFFSTPQDAKKFVAFLQSVVPCRYSIKIFNWDIIHECLSKCFWWKALTPCLLYYFIY